MKQELLVSIDTPASLAWQRDENERARRHLRSMPAFEYFRDELLSFSTMVRKSPLYQAGHAWIQREEGGGHDYPRLVVFDAVERSPRVLFDGDREAKAAGGPIRIDWFAPSPNGKILALGVTVAGTERGRTFLIDIETQKELPDVIPWISFSAVSWTRDSAGFYCPSRVIRDGKFTGEEVIHYFRVGAANASEAEPLPALRFPHVRVSKGGRYAVCITGNNESRAEYIKGPSGQWEAFLQHIPGSHVGEFDGDEFVAIVDDGYPRGRIVRIPVRTATDTSTWKELVAESENILLWMDIIDEKIVVAALRNVASIILVFDLTGRLITELDLPAHGSVSVMGAGFSIRGQIAAFTSSDQEISFVFSTATTSLAVYRYDVRRNILSLQAPAEFSFENALTRQIWATSRDGVKVPATITYRLDVAVAGPRPTWIYGYGNFGLGMLPGFNARAAAFVKAGGIFVLAHLRGGNEFGSKWMSDGQLGKKQNTFNDLYAIAEKLITDGLSSPETLSFQGASGGGLTAGVAMIQRPDLFAAIVSTSPLLDVLGMAADPLQMVIAKTEYGDPSVPEQAAWMKAYSPVENVVSGTRFPACLFVAGENDPRCPPWQSRKLAALMGEANCGESEILLRVYAGRGHHPLGIRDAAEEDGEWLAFIANETGLAAGQAVVRHR